MKKIGFISIFLMLTATAVVAQPLDRPESSIPTPAERAAVSKDAPALGAKESEDWQRLRAERRQAREQILSDLRASSAAEKNSIRKEVSKNKENRPRFEGEMPNNSRDHQKNYDKPGAHPMMPMAPMGPMGPMGPRDFQNPRPNEGDRYHR